MWVVMRVQKTCSTTHRPRKTAAGSEKKRICGARDSAATRARRMGSRAWATAKKPMSPATAPEAPTAGSVLPGAEAAWTRAAAAPETR